MFWKSQKSGILKTERGNFAPNAKIVFSVTTEKKIRFHYGSSFPFQAGLYNIPKKKMQVSRDRCLNLAIAISMHEKSDKIIELMWHFMFLKEFEKVWKGIFKYRSMPPSSSS